MKEVTFDDLIKIFGAHSATDKVRRHVNNELLRLDAPNKREEDQDRINVLKADPNTYILAMQIDDSAWNKIDVRTVMRTVTGPANTGPRKDEHGIYNVKCPLASFRMYNGDYIYVTLNNYNNLQNLMVMPKADFEKHYTISENH